MDRKGNRSKAPMRPALNSALSPSKGPPEPLPAAAKVTNQSILLSAADKQTQHQARQASAANARAVAKEQANAKKLEAMARQTSASRSTAMEVDGLKPSQGLEEIGRTRPTEKASSVLQLAYQGLQQGPPLAQSAAETRSMQPAAACPQPTSEPVSRHANSAPKSRTGTRPKKRAERSRDLTFDSRGERRRRAAPRHFLDYEIDD